MIFRVCRCSFSCYFFYFHAVDLWHLRATVAILGKGLSEASFTTIFLYTAELYPTVIRWGQKPSFLHMSLRVVHLLISPFFLLRVARQNALGYNNSMARVGVAVAPLILLLEDVWTVLPQVIICLIPIACGLLSLLLPETQGVRLPESIDDVEKQRSLESVRFQRLDMKFDTVQRNNFPAHLHFLPSSPVLNHTFIPHSLTSSLVLAHLVPFALHLTISLPHLSYFIPSSLMNQIVSLSFCFQGDAGVRGEHTGSGNLPGIQEHQRSSQSRKLRGAAGQISRGSARFLPQLSRAVIGTCPNRICPNCSSGCRWTWELQDQSCTGQLELDNVRRRAQN